MTSPSLQYFIPNFATLSLFIQNMYFREPAHFCIYHMLPGLWYLPSFQTFNLVIIKRMIYQDEIFFSRPKCIFSGPEDVPDVDTSRRRRHLRSNFLLYEQTLNEKFFFKFWYFCQFSCWANDPFLLDLCEENRILNAESRSVFPNDNLRRFKFKKLSSKKHF
jgi:hypothetical protein